MEIIVVKDFNKYSCRQTKQTRQGSQPVYPTREIGLWVPSSPSSCLVTCKNERRFKLK